MSSYQLMLIELVSSITLYIDYVSLILGTIGGICNVITFTGRKVYQSSTGFYLLCGSIFQLLTVLFCVTARLTLDRYSVNPQNQSGFLCKMRYYLVVTLPAAATYCLLLAAFDRWISTSDHAKIRAWSQFKIAVRLTLATIIVLFIVSIHILVYYDVHNNLCRITPGSAYTFVFAGYVIIFITVLPNCLMLLFSIMTLAAIRKSRRRVVSTVTPAHPSGRQRIYRKEMKLIKIIIIQVILGILLGLLRLGTYSYWILVRNSTSGLTDQYAIVTFSSTLGGSLYFFSFAISFYTSIISSKFFRQTFRERLQLFYRICTRQ